MHFGTIYIILIQDNFYPLVFKSLGHAISEGRDILLCFSFLPQKYVYIVVQEEEFQARS